MLYWLGYDDLALWRTYEYGLWFNDFEFRRVKEVYPDATLFGNDNAQWHDVMQGLTGDCYIHASMAAVAEFPQLIKNVMVNPTENEAGIYAFRFYIRGKPWIVTVDDTFLFYKNNNVVTPYFARIGKNYQYWGMLLEKAWAKMKGHYHLIEGGFNENGLKALLGCPVLSYPTEGATASEVFAVMKTAESLNYLMSADTRGGSDTMLNECGVVMGHAYSVISAFELKTGSTVDH